MVRVAILGCGPTGLLAAHACALNGVSFVIFSKKRKSELFGSQYLHEPIPGITEENDRGVDVKYVVRGTPEEYRRKTHGKWWGGHVAPEDFEPDHFAWDIRRTYDVLWRQYSRHVQEWTIPPRKLGGSDIGRISDAIAERGLNKFELVISTVPRDIWSINGEEYIYSEGWALGDAPERGVFVEDELIKDFGDESEQPDDKFSGSYIPDNTIICDGTKNVSWTRLSKVYGYTTIEWPHHAPQPHPRAVMVRKPLHYKPAEGNPNPTANWLHVGRYGQFERGIVVTDAFHDVIKKLKEMK